MLPACTAPETGSAIVHNNVNISIAGDPFVGFLETPVTSAPIVAAYLSNLPAYRTGVSPLLRGVEIGTSYSTVHTLTWVVH